MNRREMSRRRWSHTAGRSVTALPGRVATTRASHGKAIRRIADAVPRPGLGFDRAGNARRPWSFLSQGSESNGSGRSGRPPRTTAMPRRPHRPPPPRVTCRESGHDDQLCTWERRAAFSLQRGAASQDRYRSWPNAGPTCAIGWASSAGTTTAFAMRLPAGTATVDATRPRPASAVDAMRPSHTDAAHSASATSGASRSALASMPWPAPPCSQTGLRRSCRKPASPSEAGSRGGRPDRVGRRPAAA